MGAVWWYGLLCVAMLTNPPHRGRAPTCPREGGDQPMKELPMKASKTKNPPLFSNELLDHILADDTLGGDWTPIQNRLEALKGALMERMLAAEMTHHLGYKAHDDAPSDTSNRRNGYSAKTVQTDSGEVTIKVPRDRNGGFDPIIVQKYQRRLPDFDEKVIAL